jgi:hypothetical protein
VGRLFFARKIGMPAYAAICAALRTGRTPKPLS